MDYRRYTNRAKYVAGLLSKCEQSKTEIASINQNFAQGNHLTVERTRNGGQMTAALKPCPWHLDTDTLVITAELNDDGGESLAVASISCNVASCPAHSRFLEIKSSVQMLRSSKQWSAALDKVMAAWNTRAPDPRIAELEAENARLRKDAERYRWLRDNGEEMIMADRGVGASWTYGKVLDDKVDEAIKESER